MKENIIKAYDEAEELHTSLTTLSDEEIIECKNALVARTLRIMTALSDYVSDEDLN
jgi:hypothetical protein